MIDEQKRGCFAFDPKVQQAVYRCVLQAMSYPGIPSVFPQRLFPGVAESWTRCVMSTLIDENVTLHADSGFVSQEFIDAIGATVVDVESADFIVTSGRQFSLGDRVPKLGTLYRPDASATVILECHAINADASANGTRLHVTGPGVEVVNQFVVSDLAMAWIDARDDWCARYPLGVDVLLIDRQKILGIPRTSVVRTAAY